MSDPAVAVQRQQGIEAVLQSAAIIQTGQGIQHTEIVEGVAFLHQFIHQSLCKGIAALLDNILQGNTGYRQHKAVSHTQPLFPLRHYQAGKESW